LRGCLPRQLEIIPRRLTHHLEQLATEDSSFNEVSLLHVSRLLSALQVRHAIEKAEQEQLDEAKGGRI
jgi:hypothetical protein